MYTCIYLYTCVCLQILAAQKRAANGDAETHTSNGTSSRVQQTGSKKEGSKACVVQWSLEPSSLIIMCGTRCTLCHSSCDVGKTCISVVLWYSKRARYWSCDIDVHTMDSCDVTKCVVVMWSAEIYTIRHVMQEKCEKSLWSFHWYNSWRHGLIGDIT